MVATDLQHVRVVQREDWQSRLVRGVGQKEFAIADGDVGLPTIDQIEYLPAHARPAGNAASQVSARSGHGDTLPFVHRACDWHFEDGMHAAQHFGHTTATYKMEFMLRQSVHDC